MFLRKVYVYLIFKCSQWKPKPFGIKINIDLEAASVEKKIYICMVHFYPLWTEHSREPMTPYYLQRKQNEWGKDEPG